jgi:hypothetical protein
MPQEHPVGTRMTRPLVQAGAAATQTARPPSFRGAGLRGSTFLAARGESDRRGAAQAENRVRSRYH